MKRILSIDYGKKRTGLALSDPLQIIASGLDTINTPNLMSYLKNLMTKEPIETIILGYPLNLNGEETDATKPVEAFEKRIKKQFQNVNIVRVDERYTSKEAFQAMIDGGVKKKNRRNKALIDKVSATILLQNYMENKNIY